MTETLFIDDLAVTVSRKAIKNIHLAVLPPDGIVTVSMPLNTDAEAIRSFVALKLPWIHEQQEQLRSQLRESPREFVTRESLYVFGQRYLLVLQQKSHGPASVEIQNNRIVLSQKPFDAPNQRTAIMHRWYKSLLHALFPDLIDKWERRIGVKCAGYGLRKMKTKWGSCNPKTNHLLFNTDLVQKPRYLIEYVVVHELLHILEPSHNSKFTELLDKYYHHWQEARAELNGLPLAAQKWNNKASLEE